MEYENLKKIIKKTIQEGNIRKIEELFKKDLFALIEDNDFIDLWEDPDISLLNILLIVNREKNFYIFNGYKFPEKYNNYISRNIRRKLIEVFEILEDSDIKTLVWLDCINHLEKEDFSKFSEKSIKKFIKNYYNIVILSEKYKDPWKEIKFFSFRVGKSLSEVVRKTIIEIIEGKDPNEIVLIQVYGWLELLNQQDLFALLNNPKLEIFKQIFKSLKTKSYEYHGFGDQLDKDIFDHFQKLLPPKEAKALRDLQYLLSEQLILDYGYHDEIFHAYKVKNNNVVKLWLPSIKLPTLPVTIGDFNFLKEIDLNGCGLKTIPESFGNLKNLKSLDLRDCDLSTLPESFINLQNLEKLYIRGNYFDKVPEKIGKLKSLKYFDVNDTGLIDYPPFRIG